MPNIKKTATIELTNEDIIKAIELYCTYHGYAREAGMDTEQLDVSIKTKKISEWYPVGNFDQDSIVAGYKTTAIVKEKQNVKA